MSDNHNLIVKMMTKGHNKSEWYTKTLGVKTQGLSCYVRGSQERSVGSSMLSFPILYKIRITNLKHSRAINRPQPKIGIGLMLN
jgi:hypothetical protein